MAFRLPSLVHETTGAGWGGGTGDLPLAGAVAANRFAFGDRLQDGDTTIISILNGLGEYEGVGAAYDAGLNKLVRDGSPLESTNADAPVNFTAGDAQVLVGLVGKGFADLVNPSAQAAGFLKRTGTHAYGVVADPLPIANGGTAGATAAAARSNLVLKQMATGLAANRPVASALGDGFYFATDTGILSYSSGIVWTQITVGDGEVTAAKLAAGAVTAPKIAAGAVTSDKVASGTFTEGDVDVQSGPFTITSDSVWEAIGEVTVDDAGSRALFFFAFDLTTAPSTGTLDFRIVETGGPTEVADPPDSRSSGDGGGQTWIDWRTATATQGASATYQLQAIRSTTGGTDPVVSNVVLQVVVPRAI